MGPKNDGHVSKMKMSTSQAGKKDLSQEMSVLSERDKNVPSYKRKLEKSPAPLSSDYGDENFDDLPSPSRLLGSSRGSGFATWVSPVADDQAENKITDVPAIESKHTETDPSHSASQSDFLQLDQMKPSNPKPEHEIIEIPDDTPPDSEMTITKDPSAKQGTLPLTTKADQPSTLKRKASQDVTRTEHKKQVKQRPFVSALQVHASNSLDDEPPLSPEQPVSPISPASPTSPVPLVPPIPAVPVIGDQMDLNTTWDNNGIDLLDEFKDIIKFI